VHKSNLGSQLSIFDTGPSARARPRPNDPPERVQPGALKRPARTTETKRQGRAGQTSCTSVHKANLGSQLSIFDTGSSARARPRPNDPPERLQPGALKRPARTTETKRQGRAGQTSCTSVHKANLRSQLSIFDTGSSARARPRPNDPPERVHPGALKRPARTTHPNEFTRAPSNDPPERPTRTTRPNDFTRAPSNDPPERFFMGARTTETNRQGRAGQTSCTNVHKANLGSQLSIFDTALARTTHPNEFTRAPSNDPPERPTRTTSHGRPQTTHPNDPPERPTRTSSHGRPQTTRPNDPPERPARTSSHGRPQTTHPNDLPERVHTGALKRPARTNDRNEPTRESRANELHERAQSQPRVTT
jgi:hypothetical protein